MAKKALMVLCLCVLIVTCAFAAGKFSMTGQFSPFAYQNVKHTSGTYKSTYGYGFGVGFRYEAWKNVNLGLDIDMDFYNYDELNSSYDVVSIKAVGGYTYHFGDKFFALGELGVGVDERSIGEVDKMYFGLGVKLGAGYAVTESFKVTAGAAMDLSFQKGKSTKSTDFAIRPTVGVVVTP